MTEAPNPVIKTVLCGASGVIDTVVIKQKELEHIKESHPEVKFDHIVNAIENPVSVYKHHTKEKHVLIVGSDCHSLGASPIRVAVKTFGPKINFIATAWYSGRAMKGQSIWPSREKSDE